MSAQRSLFLMSRLAGDLSALQRGTLAKRVLRRTVTRNLLRTYNRLWR